jgi:hypothetical protein
MHGRRGFLGVLLRRLYSAHRVARPRGSVANDSGAAGIVRARPMGRKRWANRAGNAWLRIGDRAPNRPVLQRGRRGSRTVLLDTAATNGESYLALGREACCSLPVGRARNRRFQASSFFSPSRLNRGPLDALIVEHKVVVQILSHFWIV